MNLTANKWMEISQALEEHHAIFNEMWQMGIPVFTDELPTAAVRFSPEGEFVEFLFNEEYWDSLNDYERLFVICHECLHVILNHGIRTTRHKDHYRINWALDVVVNHLLITSFGFDRSRIRNADSLCWVDTVFKDQVNIPTNESYEYYYQLIPPNPSIEVFTVDDHSTLNGEAKKVIEKLNERLSEEDKETLKLPVEKHYQKGTTAGNGCGGWQFVKVTKIVKKKKWETVIRKWSLKYLKEGLDENEQWARVARRFELLPNDILLPSEMEDDSKDFDRINVHLYLDTSGSCIHLKDRFFRAALSLPKERFDVKCFSFDTRVKEIDLTKRKLYGGGGTRFNIIERNIQDTVKKEKTHYPKAVFLISDGYGNDVQPEFPDRWYWFLTDRASKRHIPDESKTYRLKDFE